MAQEQISTAIPTSSHLLHESKDWPSWSMIAVNIICDEGLHLHLKPGSKHERVVIEVPTSSKPKGTRQTAEPQAKYMKDQTVAE